MEIPWTFLRGCLENPVNSVSRSITGIIDMNPVMNQPILIRGSLPSS
jgi:hypothetical protein